MRVMPLGDLRIAFCARASDATAKAGVLAYQKELKHAQSNLRRVKKRAKKMAKMRRYYEKQMAAEASVTLSDKTFIARMRALRGQG